MTKKQKRLARLLPLIRELCSSGMKASQIKQHPKFKKFHLRTIRRKLASLGFADPLVSARKRNGVKMSAEQHQKFTSFLERNWKRYAIADLVRVWKQSYVTKGYPLPSADTFRYWLRKMGYAHFQGDVYRLEFTHRRLVHHLRRVRTKNIASGEARRSKRREAAEVENQQLLNAADPPESQPCRKCKTLWALEAKFWERKSSGALLLVECRLCRHEHRLAVARSGGNDAAALKQGRKLELWQARFNLIGEKEATALVAAADYSGEKRRCAGSCGCERPLTEAFFKKDIAQTTAGLRTYYRYVCRFCEDRRRLLKEAGRKGLSLPETFAPQGNSDEASELH